MEIDSYLKPKRSLRIPLGDDADPKELCVFLENILAEDRWVSS